MDDINKNNYNNVRIPISSKVSYYNFPNNLIIISDQDNSKINIGANSKKLINSTL